jgi:hypothetical protein
MTERVTPSAEWGIVIGRRVTECPHLQPAGTQAVWHTASTHESYRVEAASVTRVAMKRRLTPIRETLL